MAFSSCSPMPMRTRFITSMWAQLQMSSGHQHELREDGPANVVDVAHELDFLRGLDDAALIQLATAT